MSSRKVLIGLFLIFLGIYIGLASFDIINFNLFFPGWWTLFIIIPSVIGLFYEGDRTLNYIGLVVGCFLFLINQPFFDAEIIKRLFFPVILVIIGLSVIFKRTKKITYNESKEEVIIENKKNKKREHDDEESVLEVSTFFGSKTTDLSEKEFRDGDIIKVASVFGDNKIILSKSVNVEIKSGILFGNVYNDKVINHDNKVTVLIDCGILFGSVEIKDK